MCENLNKDRNRCQTCRTINLAKPVRIEKPNMGMYDKCAPAARIDCTRIPEVPLTPTCIRVCTKDEMLGRKPPKVLPKAPLPYAHGKIMWGVKTAILVGSVYFTYTQGVWGDQQDVTECIKRWQEYLRSINSRRPPTYDRCGNVIPSDTGGSLMAPLYMIYKEIVTTCCSGIVKVPQLIKCAYVDYLKALEKQYQEQVRERRIRRNSP